MTARSRLRVAVILLATLYSMSLAAHAAPDLWMSVVGTEAEGRFGEAVVTLGNFDGDNFDEFAVLAPGEDFGDSGRVYIFSGGNSPNPIPSRTIETSLNSFFTKIARGRDFDGDGDEELLVKYVKPVQDAPPIVEIRMYKGDSSAVPYDWALKAGQDFRFQGEFAGIGDLNGDGMSEVAAGIYNEGLDMGFVRIYLGRADSGGGADFETPYAVSYGGASPSFGLQVNHVGDLTGDGIADLAIGEPDLRLLHLYPGTGTGVVFGSPIVFHEDVAGFPRAITSGDIDGDGDLDLIVGTGNTSIGAGSNQVFVYYGGATLDLNADITLDSPDAAQDGFGWTMAASKLYGNGRDRLLVGAPFWPDASDTGRAYFYDSILSPEAITGGDNSNLGWSLAGEFDINSDGREDFVIGVPRGGPNDEGRIEVRFSEASGGGKDNFHEDPGEGP